MHLNLLIYSIEICLAEKETNYNAMLHLKKCIVLQFISGKRLLMRVLYIYTLN